VSISCINSMESYETVPKSYIQYPECTHGFIRSQNDQYGSSTKHTWSSTVIHGLTRPRTILHALYVCTKLVNDHTQSKTTKHTNNSNARSTRVLAAYFIVDGHIFKMIKIKFIHKKQTKCISVLLNIINI